MDLNISICPSEKNIAKIIGSDNWSTLSKQAFIDNPQKCFFCGFPSTEDNQKIITTKPKLNIHVLPYDENMDIEKEFKNLKTIVVCDACHAIQHFDYAVKNDWIKLVNSSFSQIDLVKICRWGNRMVNAYIIGGHKVDKNIFPLKRAPESYLQEITESKMNINKKIKVIFTKNFDWTTCR